MYYYCLWCIAYRILLMPTAYCLLPSAYACCLVPIACGNVFVLAIVRCRCTRTARSPPLVRGTTLCMDSSLSSQSSLPKMICPRLMPRLCYLLAAISGELIVRVLGWCGASRTSPMQSPGTNMMIAAILHCLLL